MVKATDEIWAQAEAWIEAEARAEDIAWREMEFMRQRSNSSTKIAESLKVDIVIMRFF